MDLAWIVVPMLTIGLRVPLYGGGLRHRVGALGWCDLCASRLDRFV